MQGQAKTEYLQGIKILYEDNHLLAVEKPVGLAVQGGPGISENLLDHLKAAIKKRDQKPGDVFLALVHRLDQPVGGLLLLAKTSKAASRLAESLRRHEIEKHYWAVCSALPAVKSGTLQHLLIKDRRTNQSRVVAAQEPEAKWAKPASLDYRVLSGERDLTLSLLDIRLETGRSHQIRVQLAEQDWPLWGDYRYNPAWRKAEKGQSVALWSHSLAFIHPVTKERIELFSKPVQNPPWNYFAEFL